MNLGPFRLEADWSFREIASSGADLRAVDLGLDGAVGLADDLGGVPLADGLGGLVLGSAVELRVAGEFHPRHADQLTMVPVHALDLDAPGPDVVRSLNVHQRTAVAGELAVIL